MADLVRESSSARREDVRRFTAGADDSNLTSNPLLSHDSFKFQESVNVCMILKCEEIICFISRTYHVLTRKYRYAPHNVVSFNDGPHIRRWSHKIIILQYNIIIHTTVLQLPTLFSTVTCCTGL
jgi:hypothetical protein